jgi:microcystin degradation protein MlrC
LARIAIGGFQHETNCFIDEQTDYAYFTAHRDRPPLVAGQDMLTWLRDTGYATAGFLGIMEARHELLPLLWTSGGAGGLVTDDAFERILGNLLDRLKAALPLDGVYLDLHGAMVTRRYEDGEGEMLRRVREVVGETIPVVISLDYHANVTPEMVETTDAVVAFLTYPHVDRAETGQRAARAMELLLARGRPAGRALRKLPFLIPLNDQCTLVEPSAGIVAMSQLAEGEVVTLAYLAGFPPADLHWCGPSVVAHAWTQQAADEAADAMARAIEEREAEFAVEMVTPAEGVARAMAQATHATRPVVIADTQDNPGCGGNADTTGLLKALVQAGAEAAVLGFLCDADAAQAAHAAGLGAGIRLALGGRTGPEGVSPLEAEFRVLALGDGRMRLVGCVARGRVVDLGPMALLGIGGVSVAVTSKRFQALDLEPFRHLGIEPAQQKILALKSTCHFRGEFEPIAESVIVVLAPGYHRADPASFPYRRLRGGVRLRPLGPRFVPANA